MIIKETYPPNYELLKMSFPNLEAHVPIFCYGNIIYNPFKIEVTKSLEVHEEVHMKQQGNNIETWWIKYCTDPHFRLSQEIEAYGTQYALSLKIAPRKISDWVKEKCAQSLSGELYGNLLTYGEAESKIRKYAKRNS